MKVKIKDILNALEATAPLNFQETYDNSGLLIGSADNDVDKVLVCFDLTHTVVQEAIAKRCLLIISHHPIIFNPLKRIQGVNDKEKAIIAAIKNDIAVYAAHTNLDNAAGGVNALFAEKIGLVKTKALKPVKGSLRKLVTFCPLAHSGDVRTAICEAGAGHIGDYDFCTYNIEGKGSFRASEKANPFVGQKKELHFEEEIRIETIYPTYMEKKILEAMFKAHPYEEVAYDIYPLENEDSLAGAGIIGFLKKPTNPIDFLNNIKETFNATCLKYSAINKKNIEKVALCGGSGSFLTGEAVKQKADIFISAEFKHNHFIEAVDNIIIADIGHYESEYFAKELICKIITKKFSNFAVEISKKDTNPVKYL